MLICLRYVVQNSRFPDSKILAVSLAPHHSSRETGSSSNRKGVPMAGAMEGQSSGSSVWRKRFSEALFVGSRYNLAQTLA